MRGATAGSIMLVAALACACSPSDEREPGESGGTRVLADYTLAGGFFSAPFPDATRQAPDGRPLLSEFPNPTASVFLEKLRALLERDARGYGTTAGIFLSLDGALDPEVESDFAESIAGDARVFLMDVDDSSPDRGRRLPVRVHFAEDAGPFAAPNLLSLVPLQGIPLRANTRYAAVVTREVRDTSGARLGVPTSLQRILRDELPDGMSEAAFDEHRAAVSALDALGVPKAELAGLAAFTTDDPTRDLGAVREAMLAAPPPSVAAFAAKEVFPDFCVFESTLEMPVFQAGAPPFKEEGGEWQLSPDGTPLLQGKETARIVVTLPRRAMPAAGFPVVIMSRTGGGGDRPLVDRGVRATPGGAAIAPGTGPALQFARAGWAGVSVDGPHGGLRNVTGGDEQFLMFNVTNPAALRDNVRQSAAEIALQAHVLAKLAIDAASCPDLVTSGGPAKLDANALALMGHSMGATIAPLVLATEPMFRAGILSGAGGSWIENVLYKQKPVPVKGFAELLLGVAGKHSLSESDPALSLFQWAAEPADPPVYGRAVVHEPAAGAPRHVLLLQGIVDHYIMPSIANATSLSLGLDLAGDSLDAATAELADLPHLEEVIAFSGRAQIALPATGNVSAGGKPKATAVVVQHPEDGVEDGHEVVFQTAAPKHQYQCFLESLAAGLPRVPKPAGELAACE
ncbi:MAG: hypothetical protein IPM35_32750 [Myxococcales bacterium]|nr:hypothetical protein [Myxococcales bacterium]